MPSAFPPATKPLGSDMSGRSFPDPPAGTPKSLPFSPGAPGMLGDCHRRIELFLNVLVRIAEPARGEALNDEQRGALEAALRYFRDAAPKHTADGEESLFPRLRRIEDSDVRALLMRIESLEEEHVCADRSHGEVDNLGRLWLKEGRLSAEQGSRILAVLVQLRDLYRDHIATEDNKVFPAAAATLSTSDREAIGRGMASRRGLPVSAQCGFHFPR